MDRIGNDRKVSSPISNKWVSTGPRGSSAKDEQEYMVNFCRTTDKASSIQAKILTTHRGTFKSSIVAGKDISVIVKRGGIFPSEQSERLDTLSVEKQNAVLKAIDYIQIGNWHNGISGLTIYQKG